MARLSHPNVIVIHDVGTFQDDVFIAMEYVDGCTLRQWLHAEPRTWQEILDIFVQAGRGLSAAHSAGIVHRDFKPENVLVGKDGRARVVDFGLARGTVSVDSAATVQAIGAGTSARSISPKPFPSDTKSGLLIGTPAYMAAFQRLKEVPGVTPPPSRRRQRFSRRRQGSIELPQA